MTREGFVPVTIKVLGLPGVAKTGFDDQYLAEYDPSKNGFDPLTGAPMRCHLVTTPDVTDALHMDFTTAIKLWQQVDPRCPVRADGKPNRPLTAFHIELERA